ncbi:hypothetical protein ACMS1Z_01105 [Acidiphilium multivorum]|uniref:hypothetical protein n=1 Tax=Acidiphilium multivorum TaxID=62140 RepID=UPI0039C981E0
MRTRRTFDERGAEFAQLFDQEEEQVSETEQEVTNPLIRTGRISNLRWVILLKIR